MEPALSEFRDLTPDSVLNLVESALGRRASNLCRPLSSYINRVYELHLEDGEWVVAKFFRPGRWTRAALEEEQAFVRELAEDEVPVIAPLSGFDGKALFEHDGMCFAIYPKKGGRPLEEPSAAQWRELGRLLARMHVVGSRRNAPNRIRLAPDISSREQVDEILALRFPMPSVRDEYARAAYAVLDRIAPCFREVEAIRLHGDCHCANIIARPNEGLFLIDFDDMCVGPAVQDLWMLLPGHVRDSRAELDGLLEGYETFRSFDETTLRLIEPLRAMRMIHYTAWCARQASDGGFSRLAPDFGTPAFWRAAAADLQRQLQEIEDATV